MVKSYNVEIDGHPFMLYISPPTYQYTRSFALTRIPKAGVASEVLPSEAGVGFFDTWAQRSWHLGEGQKVLRLDDPQKISPYRYWKSLGVDISKEGIIKNLFSTTKELALSQTYHNLAEANERLWTQQGLYNLWYRDGTWTSRLTGYDGGAITGMASDGTTLYICGGTTAGAHEIRAGNNVDAFTVWKSGVFNKLFYQNNNMFALGGNVFYRFAMDGTELFKFPPTGALPIELNCLWGTGEEVFFGGSRGEHSYVYKYDGTEAKMFVELPAGVRVVSLYHYLDMVFVGARKCVDYANSRYNGLIYWIDPVGGGWGLLCEIEPEVNVDAGIYAMTGLENSLFFSWNEIAGVGRYDIANGGISRNLHAGGTARVDGIAYFRGNLFFTVATGANEGVWRRGTALCEGSLESSICDLNTSLPKLWFSIGGCACPEGGGKVSFYYSQDEGFTYDLAGICKTFTHYSADVLPAAASPPWTKTGSAIVEEISPPGILHLVNTTLLRYHRDESDFNSLAGVTVEVRAKNVDDINSIISIFLADGAYRAELLVYHDRVYLEGQTYYMNTHADYHSYRLAIQEGKSCLWIDGGLVFSLVSLGTSSLKRVWFQLSGGATAECWIDYASYVFYLVSPEEENLSKPSPCFAEFPIKQVADSMCFKLVLEGQMGLRKMVARGVILNRNAYQWKFSIWAAEDVERMDEKVVPMTAAQLRKFLRGISEQRRTVTFKDLDNEIYSCIVLDCSETVLQVGLDRYESIFEITLVQVS